MIVDVSSFFKMRSVLIDLSQVVLVTSKVAIICNRINKLGKVALLTAKGLERVLTFLALGYIVFPL